MLLVMNFYRPLTSDSVSMLEVMGEMETACGMKFTGVLNNSNLGEETCADDVIRSMTLAREFSEKSGLPLLGTFAKADLKPDLEGRIPNLTFLNLQKKYY